MRAAVLIDTGMIYVKDRVLFCFKDGDGRLVLAAPYGGPEEKAWCDHCHRIHRVVDVHEALKDGLIGAVEGIWLLIPVEWLKARRSKYSSQNAVDAGVKS